MCDVHLTQCLDETDCVDGILKESCCNMKDILRDTFRLEDGLDLVVSQNHKTLRRIGMLVLSGNRFKNSSNIIKELVKETIVETRVNVCKTGRRYECTNRERDFTLHDLSQGRIVFVEWRMKLQAVCLRAGQDKHIVNFKMVSYSFDQPPPDGQLVRLSIKEYSLSSSMTGDKAELCLEKVAKERLGAINSDSDLRRFLFIRRSRGVDQLEFESVQCPNWFISTSADQPVEMSKKDAPRNIYFRTS